MPLISRRKASPQTVVSRGARWPAEASIIPAILPDGSLAPIEKMEAHRTGSLHLAVSVFVFSGDHLLIQRRASSKYHCGSMWANTCCSHPQWDESPSAAASRRLEEELGLRLSLVPTSIVTYRAHVTRGLIEHERVHVFRGEADRQSMSLRLNQQEVSQTRWVSLEEVRRDVEHVPGAFAPWFRIYLARWDELGL